MALGVLLKPMPDYTDKIWPNFKTFTANEDAVNIVNEILQKITKETNLRPTLAPNEQYLKVSRNI